MNDYPEDMQGRAAATAAQQEAIDGDARFLIQDDAKTIVRDREVGLEDALKALIKAAQDELNAMSGTNGGEN